MKIFKKREVVVPPIPEKDTNPGVCPEFTSSVFSKLTFGWVQPLMSLGSKRPLEREDIWELTERRRAAFIATRFREKWALQVAKRDASRLAMKNKEVDYSNEKGVGDLKKKKKSGKVKEYKPSLWLAINNTFLWVFWSAGVLKVIGDSLQVFQPMVTKAIITFVTTSAIKHKAGLDDEMPPMWYGIVLAIVLYLMGVFSTLSMHQFWQRSTGVGVGIRTCLITTIYRKGLVLSSKAKQDFTTGKITNLMSTDTARLDFLAGYFHILWSAPLMVLIILILLIVNMGPSALVGFVFLVAFGPIQARIVRALSVIRRKSTLITDARVKLTQEVLQGMRVIKFYGWEDAFLGKLEDLRTRELKYVRTLLISRSAIAAVNLTVPVLAATLTFVTYSLTGHELNAAIIFSSLSLFNIMRMPLMIFPQVVSGMVDAMVSVRRIEDFLLADELEDLPVVNHDAEFAISITDASFQWDTSLKAVTMEELQAREKAERNRSANKKEQKKELKAKERAEKKAIKKLAKSQNISEAEAEKQYREAKEQMGSEQSSETMSIQEKVLARATEKDPSPDTESILSSSHGVEFEPEVAAVEEKSSFALKNIDLHIPRGQLVAIVGAVGSGKSSILNALVGEMRKTAGSMEYGGTIGYCPQSAWIQNATVKENILFGLPLDEGRYQQVIKDCALERDIQILPNGDQTEIGERGINLSGGQKQRVNIARAVYFDADVVLLDDPLSAVDAHVGKYLFKNCILGALHGKTRVLVTHQLHVLPQVDYVICMKDGAIVERGTFQELMAKEGEFSTLMKAHGGIDEQEVEVESTDDHSVSSAITAGAEKAAEAGIIDKKDEKKKDDTPSGKRKGLMSQEERSTGSVDGAIYKGYVQAAGGLYLIPLLISLLILTQVAKVGNDLWLSWWSDNQFNESQKFYMILYAVWGILQGIFQFINGFFFSIGGASAAKVLHQRALQNIFRAPSSFFDTTPLGRIINRFSKDVDSCDNLLSESYRMFTGTAAIVLSTFILISVIFPWFLLPLVPMLIFYYYAAIYYRSSSRELKRIDSILRSSLYAHFSETLSGMATIRAYREQNRFIERNAYFIDLENRPYFMSYSIQRWLGVRLETIANTLVFCTSLLGVCGRLTILPGTIGLVLSYSMSVTGTFNWCVRQYAEVENNMNAVERLYHYAENLEQEADAVIPDNRPTENWPTQGSISIRNLEMRYRPDLPTVLHDLSLDIRGGEKIGVVGRTGAGKSSIMMALFRLVEPSKGTMEIDGMDICKMGLFDLRTRLAIIPQDPVLFSGTIRTNLDPFEKRTDAELWEVLDRSDLKTYVASCDGGLDSQVTEFGENLSVGQRQLLCLARAMLTHARVIIMDEATASVDVATDVMLQKAIRVDFADSTVLTIAHRLNTVIDYSRVLVLDHGEIKEFDTPANLLARPDSVFGSMVDETGPANSALLRSLAIAAANGQAVAVEEVLAVSGETEAVTSASSESDKAEVDTPGYNVKSAA
ncbi:ATP-binding cassette, subfamily C (CFTR/MRP), member 1 [Entomortierella parvispora]|uniref:ATP-binding cassette, subfamily C (CFTR/MRP), member 1 n=1 Tax=Entomortierella parvispora TaxID=205924 RepID=A0A9P3HCG8_9FUNG|nr:ATP-binding cassette, subfamily C (CFTR/MRP), member 1 [Entomortierella parvispora]